MIAAEPTGAGRAVMGRWEAGRTGRLLRSGRTQSTPDRPTAGRTAPATPAGLMGTDRVRARRSCSTARRHFPARGSTPRSVADAIHERHLTP